VGRLCRTPVERPPVAARSLPRNRACPKVLEPSEAAESTRRALRIWWAARRSRYDLPSNVRRYYSPAFATAAARVASIPRRAAKPRSNLAEQPNPSNRHAPSRDGGPRRLVTKRCRAPLPAVIRGSSRELVAPTHNRHGFPAIPGLPLPTASDSALRYDFAPAFHYTIFGRDRQAPPVIRQVLPSLVPRVDNRRQRNQRCRERAASGSARHLHGLEHYAPRVQQSRTISPPTSRFFRCRGSFERNNAEDAAADPACLL